MLPLRPLATSTLASEVEARGSLPVQEAVGYTLEACAAIAEAHALGIAHGDVTLENMRLVRDGDGSIAKIALTAATADGASRNDVERDIAALGSMLRTLVAGRFENEQDGAQTLPSGVMQVISRAAGQDPEGAFHNVAELARALEPWAPSGSRAVQSSSFVLSRAGIVGSAIPLSAPDRPSMTGEWFGPGSRQAVEPTFAAVPQRRARTFTIVSLALVGFVLGGSWILWQNDQLPHWTGTAPTEQPVGTTNVTSAPAAPVSLEPMAEPAEAPATSTPVEALPPVATVPTLVRKASPEVIPTSAPVSVPTTEAAEPEATPPAPSTETPAAPAASETY